MIATVVMHVVITVIWNMKEKAPTLLTTDNVLQLRVIHAIMKARQPTEQQKGPHAGRLL